jgi:hypothetical protein
MGFGQIALQFLVATLIMGGLPLWDILASNKLKPVKKDNEPHQNGDRSEQFPATVKDANYSSSPSGQQISDPNNKKSKRLLYRMTLAPIRAVIDWLHEYDEIVTAAATAAIAYLTWSLAEDSKRQANSVAGQLRVMQGQLDAMERDEAPYVAMTEKTAGPTFQAISGEGYVLWDWHFTNLGKGRAINVSVDAFMALGKGKLKRNPGANGPSLVATVPQGKDDFSTAVYGPLSQDDFNKFMAMNGGFNLLVEFKYSDITGKSFESASCISRIPTGAMVDLDPKLCAGFK